MSISGVDYSRRTSAIDRDDGIRPLGRARTPALIGGAPFSSLLQKSGCASDNGGIDGVCTVHGLHPPRWFSTRGSGEFDHAVSIDVSTCSLTISLNSTRQYKDSSIVPTRVVDSTGCMVPINLRAILRAYRGVGHYPAGHSALSLPKETYHTVELLSLYSWRIANTFIHSSGVISMAKGK